MSIESMWILALVLIVTITEVYTRQNISDFETSHLLQVEKGQYVEIRFSIWKPYRLPGVPCADEEYLEILDGYNQSANLLGVFCGRITPYFTLRSSGHNMWLRFSPQHRYRFRNSSYEGKAINGTVLANLTGVAQTQFVLLDHSSSLWCPAEGGPAPHIVWRINGTVVQNSTSVRYRLNITEEERIANYSCEVDSNGLLKRKNITLIVESCPEPCQCIVLKGNMEGLLSVDCEGKQLKLIPQNIPRATGKLNLSKNNLKNLLTGIFSNNRKLRYLDLSENKLETLPPEIFYHLWRLRGLDLSSNKLKDLPNGTFTSLHDLTHLELSNNRLKDLPNGSFNSLRYLLRLDLSYNLLEQLPLKAFHSNTFLFELFLNNNNLKSLSKTQLPCRDPCNSTFQNLTLDFNKLETLLSDLFEGQELVDLWLGNNNLKTLPEDLFKGQSILKYLRLVGNQLKTLPLNIFHGLTNLEELDLSYNQLQNLSRGVLSTNTELRELDLSNNEIKHLPLDVFGNLTKLKKLFLSSNRIQRLPHFNHLSEIETLYMDNNSLAKLSADQFYGLSKLKDLRFHFNKIREMSNEQFKDVAPTIRFLYFHYNRMRRLPEGFLSNMPYLITATVDTNMMCCQLTKEDADSDYVYVDSFASCETMFRNRAPRTCIWAIGIMSLVGAIFVITWRMVFREKNIVQPIMLIHLAVSDGLMGIYLITISWKDAIWAGQYHLHDYSWRTSLACQIIGAIAVLSSEVSLMLLSLISADRLKNIVFPFHVGGLTNKATHALCFIIWIIGFIIAFLPTIGIQYFRAPAGDDHFYGKSVVCLPLQLSNDKAPGWEYSVVVFVGLNLTFVAFVVLAYLAIVINRFQVQAMSANTQRETALAKRVFLIILTDCVCWMPIIVIGLRSIVEKSFSTSGDLAVWIAVFVLPLNSAINPILYTLSTTQVRDVLKAKWQQLCRYFVAKCGRTKNGEGGRHTGTVQTLAMRALNTAGGEEGPNKEALEEPEKEQAEVPKHEDPRVEHTEPQDKEPQDIKRKKPPKPGQPETEPFESNEQITAQPKKTRTEDHTKSQNDAAANSQYEQQHADFSGEEEQNQGLDDDNDRSEAQETAEAPQTKTDGELSETMMDTAL